MNIFDTILWPIKWVIEAILVGWHWFLTNVLQLDASAGLTWVLAIVGLTVVVRAALIPIFVRQIKSKRRMMEVAPQLKKIQDKYKGKKDQFSREAMSRETMALYQRTGTNPLSSCLPLLQTLMVSSLNLCGFVPTGNAASGTPAASSAPREPRYTVM